MSDKIKDVTGESFAADVLQASGPMLVNFWAELTVVGLNIDQNPETGPKYDPQSIPIFLMFNNGEDGARRIGALSKSQLMDFLDANL